MTICEENENSPNYSSPQATPVHLCKTASDNYVQKRSLINGVLDAVEQVMQHFSPASDQQELNALGKFFVTNFKQKMISRLMHSKLKSKKSVLCAESEHQFY